MNPSESRSGRGRQSTFLSIYKIQARAGAPPGPRRVQVISRNVLLSQLGERCSRGVVNTEPMPPELRGSLGSAAPDRLDDALPLVMHGSVGRHVSKVAGGGVLMRGKSD